MKLLDLILVTTLMACGGGGSSTVDGPPGGGHDSPISSGGCTITLSGDQTVTTPCRATAGKKDSDGSSIMGLVVSPEPAGFTEIAVSFQSSAPPAVKAYAASDWTSGGATVLTTAPKSYTATIGTTPTGTVGTFNVTTATPGLDDQGTTIYTIHGSFSATLAQAGGSGTVMMTATF